MKAHQFTVLTTDRSWRLNRKSYLEKQNTLKATALLRNCSKMSQLCTLKQGNQQTAAETFQIQNTPQQIGGVPVKIKILMKKHLWIPIYFDKTAFHIILYDNFFEQIENYRKRDSNFLCQCINTICYVLLYFCFTSSSRLL